MGKKFMSRARYWCLALSAAVALAASGACSTSRLPAGEENVGQIQQLIFPSGFAYETVLSGLTRATSMAFLPPTNGARARMLIAQKAGRIRVAQEQSNGSWTLLGTDFFNLTEVNSALDRGLLSIAVHPEFPAQPFVYVFYAFNPAGLPGNATNDGSRVMRVERFTADSAQNYNVAIPGSRTTILGRNSTLANVGDPATPDSRTLYACQGAPTAPHVNDCIPADSNNHAGGMLLFGRDGSLFVATGDGTPPNGNPRAIRSQQLDSLAGKLLRINPATGAGFTTNPFYNGNVDSNRSRVFAYGIRNPFRIAQHPTATDVYIGDVGWNSWEELDVGPAGTNFGWPCYEGGNGTSVQQASYASLATCQTLYSQGTGAVRAPIFGYNHNGSGASIILGSFYTGTSYPAQFQNGLFFYDFNLTWIKFAQISGSTATISDFATDAGVNNNYDNGIVQMLAGPDTNLYTVNLSTIRRIRFSTANTPPIARATATPTSGNLPLTVQFNGSGSSDAEGQPLTFRWTFGDGGTSTAANPSHAYTTGGVFDATLTVTDSQNATGSATVRIFAGNTAPVVTMSTPAAGTTFAVGQTIAFSGSATDAQSGNLSAVLDWEVLLHHNDHTHFDAFSATGPSGSFVVSDHGELNWSLEICATASDPQGLSTTVCRPLPARTSSYTFATNPPGLSLTVAGVSQVAPFTVAAIVNSTLQIVAPATQNNLTFQSWSDGGTANHDILIGTTARTLTATYAGTAGGPIANGTYRMLPTHIPGTSTPQCADVSGRSTASGADVIQWNCNGQTNQQWRFTHLGGGIYEIRAVHSNLCLSVQGNSSSNGADVVQLSCSNATGQRWLVRPVSGMSGVFELLAQTGTNRCLDVFGVGTAAGTDIVQWACLNAANQRFRVVI